MRVTDRADLGPQRRQRGQQLPLDDQPLVGHRADLGVHRGVDLDTPRRGGRVRRREIGERRSGPAGARSCRGSSGRSWRSRPGSPRCPSTPGRRPRRSRAGTRNARRNARTPGGHDLVATTPPFRQPIRSASTTAGTPPSASKHSASSANVVSARSLSAKRTNRNRHHASTAQNTCSPPSTPQSITRCSPGDHTAGRRPRWLSLRHNAFCSATSRRKLRADPS